MTANLSNSADNGNVTIESFDALGINDPSQLFFIEYFKKRPPIQIMDRLLIDVVMISHIDKTGFPNVGDTMNDFYSQLIILVQWQLNIISNDVAIEVFEKLKKEIGRFHKMANEAPSLLSSQYDFTESDVSFFKDLRDVFFHVLMYQKVKEMAEKVS